MLLQQHKYKNKVFFMNNKNILSFLEKIPKPHKTNFPSPIIFKEKLTDKEKINEIEKHFEEILKILGLDLENDSLKDTPKRIATMYVEEIFKGLKPENFPTLRFFEDISSSDERVILIKNITLNSFCEHHFLPMIGKAYVAYIPNEKIIGLSKINRIVDYFAKRPQIQERLTAQIADSLSIVLETDNLAVYTKLNHLCVTIRGTYDHPSNTSSYYLKGKFKEQDPLRKEFFSQIK